MILIFSITCLSSSLWPFAQGTRHWNKLKSFLMKESTLKRETWTEHQEFREDASLTPNEQGSRVGKCAVLPVSNSFSVAFTKKQGALEQGIGPLAVQVRLTEKRSSLSSLWTACNWCWAAALAGSKRASLISSDTGPGVSGVLPTVPREASQRFRLWDEDAVQRPSETPQPSDGSERTHSPR